METGIVGSTKVAEIKPGEPFGLDNAAIAKIDWGLALKRVIHDLRSDFIFAPHLGFIYRKAGDELIVQVKSELQSGGFSPGVPMTIEVPKSFRMRVTVSPIRLGPSFSRPGSILPPKDRLFYQALADEAAPIIDAKIDGTRSFSHKLAEPDSESMFLPTRTCWTALQDALATHAAPENARYILKLDVANFFGSLNQHTLINTLNDSGYPKSLSSRLEAILTSYTGERSSRGILQGMYPSDLFGNYYLAPIDRILDDTGVPSARDVDDIYVFVDSVDSASRILREMIPSLRGYDLVLNENKSMLMPKSALQTEEPDLQALFEAAVAEIAEQLEDSDFDVDYGFQSEWDDDDDDDDDEPLELKATKVLFDSIAEHPGQEENIERFCLPLFSTAGSEYAVDHVIDAMKKRPSMAQIYASYLSRFISTKEVHEALIKFLEDASLVDWQRMWVLAALLRAKPKNDRPVRAALAILKDANRHEASRAVAAIYVGTFGDLARRKALISIYSSTSAYIQAAIYYSSRLWPAVERGNAKASWGGHGELNHYLTIAMTKK